MKLFFKPLMQDYISRDISSDCIYNSKCNMKVMWNKS